MLFSTAIHNIYISLDICISIREFIIFSISNLKVASAERRGAAGVILYSDPKDVAPSGSNFTYPNSVLMPKTAAQAGSVYLNNGDPQTPFYPSTGKYKCDF